MSDQRLLSEIQWLSDNPHFAERPATIREFIGADYLALQDTIRPGVMAALIEIFGEEVDPNWISLKRRAAATGGIGWGKDLLLSEKVLTPSGWVKNEDLSVGDQVIGSDGHPTRITSTVEVPDTQQYRLHFKDRSWIDCGADHLWEVRYRGGQGSSVICAENLYLEQEERGHLREGGGPSAGYRYHIPLVDPVHFTQDGDLPCDAYTVGVFIANGSMGHGTPRITTHDQDRDEILASIETYGCVMSLEGRPTNADRMIFRAPIDLKRKWSNPLARRLNEAGVYGYSTLEKFIPERYLRAPVEDRLALLRGLMDSDGHVTSANSAVYSTSAPALVDDIMDLVRGLGGYCTVSEFDRSDRPMCSTEYHVMVNLGDVCPFRLRRKASRWRPRTNQKPRRSITHIERLGRGPGRCISVDAPDQLFVTKDYILTHNSTLASIILTYCVHWCYCLKDPQGFFKLMPGSRIAFMLMSTSESQAKEVLFADIKARIEGSPWFQQFCDYDRNFKNQLRMAKDLWIVPGGSEESRFEGYNVLVGIIDEGDSHKQTKRKDYAEEGYDTISSRISSRFTDPVSNKYRGLLVVIGQMKSKVGFMSKIYAEFKEDPDAAAIRMPYWLSFGWHHYTENPRDIEGGRETAPRKSFVYDVQHKRILSREDADAAGVDYWSRDSGYLEVPTAFLTQFRRNPVKSLRDLAGIPPEASDPFVALPHRILLCQDAWEARMGEKPPVGESATHPMFTSSFKPVNRIRRVAHVDIAYSGENGDAMGIAMAHIPGIISVDGEDKPLIVFDFLMRIKAKPGGQIELSEMRRILRQVRDDHGFNLSMITFDGFASVDSMQLLRKASFQVDYVSVDRNKQPYEDLREGIYDERILFPKYMTRINEDDLDTVNIAYQELSQLTDVGPKIDHPPAGSKDVADAMAGCVSVLMQMPQWRRGAPLLETRSGGASSSDVVSEDLAPVEQMLNRASRPPSRPGQVPSLSEFLEGQTAQPGIQSKPRRAAPFVGRSGSVPTDPFLR